MDFIKAIKMVYERDFVIKRESKGYCSDSRTSP